MTAMQLRNLATTVEDGFNDLDGFEDLNEGDQAKVIKGMFHML